MMQCVGSWHRPAAFVMGVKVVALHHQEAMTQR